jgi:hypothetical protein
MLGGAAFAGYVASKLILRARRDAAGPRHSIC